MLLLIYVLMNNVGDENMMNKKMGVGYLMISSSVVGVLIGSLMTYNSAYHKGYDVGHVIPGPDSTRIFHLGFDKGVESLSNMEVLADGGEHQIFNVLGPNSYIMTDMDGQLIGDSVAFTEEVVRQMKAKGLEVRAGTKISDIMRFRDVKGASE